MADSQASAKRIEAAQRRIQALALRLEGKTYAQIGEAMGFTEQRAHRLVTCELRRLNAKRTEQAGELRRLDGERLDAMIAVLWPAVKKGRGPAIDRVLSIMHRKAKLFGLDAPTKKEVGNLDGEPFKLYGGFNPESV
jgi:hypothetical protein